ERQFRRRRQHFGGAVDADENLIVLFLRRVLTRQDRQERIAARECRQIDFRVQRAIGAQEHIHARPQAHHRQRRLRLRVENDRVANGGETKLVHSERHKVRVREERERIADLADTQLAVLFDRKRLKLVVEKDFAQRLLAALGGRHGCLREFPTQGAVQTTNARFPQHVSANELRWAAFSQARRMLCPPPRPYSGARHAARGYMKPFRWAFAVVLGLSLAVSGCGPRQSQPMTAFEGKLSDWAREILADSPETASQTG